MREESARWRRAGAREERQKVKKCERSGAHARAPRRPALHFEPLHQLALTVGRPFEHWGASLRCSLCPWSSLWAALWKRLLAGVVSPRLLLVAAHSRNGGREDVRRARVRVLND